MKLYYQISKKYQRLVMFSINLISFLIFFGEKLSVLSKIYDANKNFSKKLTLYPPTPIDFDDLYIEEVKTNE